MGKKIHIRRRVKRNRPRNDKVIEFVDNDVKADFIIMDKYLKENKKNQKKNEIYKKESDETSRDEKYIWTEDFTVLTAD